MPNKLTTIQRNVLDFIHKSVKSRGFPPTRGEIAKHFGWRSLNNADQHLRLLEKKRRIQLTDGTARGIRLL